MELKLEFVGLQFINKNTIPKLFKENLPNSEKIFSKIINLPMGNGLSEEDTMFVIRNY